MRIYLSLEICGPEPVDSPHWCSTLNHQRIFWKMACKLWFIISHHPHHRFTKIVATDKHFLIEKPLLRLFWTHGNSGRVMNLTGPWNLCALSPPTALCIPSIWLFLSYTFLGQTSDLVNTDIPHFILLHFIVLFGRYCIFFFFIFIFSNWRFVATLCPASCHFSNSICSLHVFESYFGNSCTISNI